MKEKPNKMKTFALYVFLGVLLLSVVNSLGVNQKYERKDYSWFIQMLNKLDDPDATPKLLSITINDKEISGKYQESVSLIKGQNKLPQSFHTVIPEDQGLMDLIRKAAKENKLIVKAEPPAQMSWWLNLLINWFPFIILIGAWLFILNKMQGGGAKALSFGKSRARMIDPSEKRVLFKDVAGINEAKEDLLEVVEFLRDPRKFTDLGAKIPRGVLLFGPPGTGKTLLARAVAGEASVPFFNISGSEFVEMFVGVGASRVRDLFDQARKNAPCIIFMDEIDAVGRQRGAGLGGGHDEREQTLNQILVEMDGFDNTKGIILIAATNRPDVLDPALLRPGRFDRQIVVDRPDIRGREEILQIHVREKPIADDVDLNVLARRTPGFAGAELANLTNEAAILAARKGRKVILMSDFEASIDKVIAGSERKSRIISEKEKTNTAVHEMGHALVAHFLPDTDPVHKITIIPRGMALGLTMQLPVEDRLSVSRTHLKNQICILLAGRVAEDLVFHEITSGASNDIERATKIARKMICELGMSDELGPLHLAESNQPIFLGRDFSTRNDISNETAHKIDEEIKKLIDWAFQEAKRILTENREILDRCSKALLERETINAEEFEKLIKGEELEPLTSSSKPAVKESSEPQKIEEQQTAVAIEDKSTVSETETKTEVPDPEAKAESKDPEEKTESKDPEEK